ncbi:hypothetical protein ACFQ4A_04005 [Lentibacillus salinarum]|uniref:Uncharacterized protein n=1 Tax=Lentibacillus salinarum TaxID=446820 RepID=A0ABW3ZR28_9BACI
MIWMLSHYSITDEGNKATSVVMYDLSDPWHRPTVENHLKKKRGETDAIASGTC